MKKGKIYLSAIVEGGAVMIAELCANKMVTPFFGTSIQVWAATLGVTLIALAIGYRLGSQLAKRKANTVRYLRICFYVASLGFLLASMVFNAMGTLLLDMPLEAGASIVVTIILFPILIALGACSSLFINLLDENLHSTAGNASGMIYSISTLGGVIATFVMGFYLIPYWGVKQSMVATGLLLGANTLMFSQDKKITLSSALLLLPILAIAGVVQFNNPTYNPYFKVLYETDGLLGNIKVVEHRAEHLGMAEKMGRGLVVNNTLQSFMDVHDPYDSSIWEWSNIIPTAMSIYPTKKTKVLLCGLGGGTIVKQLRLLDFEFEVVELDHRLIQIGRDYFKIDKSTKITIDDARHFINITKNKYDIVIFDTFLSESAPEQLLTVEAISRVKEILNPGGMLLTNFYGFTSGELGYACRSVMKTYMKAGLKVYPIATPGNEDGRNVLIIGTDTDKDFSKVHYEETDGIKITDLRGLVIPSELLDMNDAEVLYDNNPKLAKLYAEPSKMWKRGYNYLYTKRLFE